MLDRSNSGSLSFDHSVIHEWVVSSSAGPHNSDHAEANTVSVSLSNRTHGERGDRSRLCPVSKIRCASSLSGDFSDQEEEDSFVTGGGEVGGPSCGVDASSGT